MSIIGKDGDKRNIPVALAGIHLDDRATFTDKGKQLGAQLYLAHLYLAQWGFKLQLKFYSVHLRFNIMDKFKPMNLSETQTRILSQSLSGSGTRQYTKLFGVISTTYILRAGA
ncbi:hypothetical protein PPTG_16629 [Phytophthora nicotianae INRA-310]|uniref:Uncharacterized protein n=1 Tax=Phytophthora nicotianae (strain INRA-310) TaxID=761204 RepID=W2PNI4_PHYN3|nr:hypothetical protein PPTG_16629 [Phytophthora nicotianae INRA-310]ETN02427.1 hypothetical protein PPTG_16629 [Phytophthora nicotianae INRA-310]